MSWNTYELESNVENLEHCILRNSSVNLNFIYIRKYTQDLDSGCVHGARYFTNFRFIDLEATMGTYELHSYGSEQ